MGDVPSRIVDLVETFDRNIDACKNLQYNQARLRREFIDPPLQNPRLYTGPLGR
jgi:hypothetical protein